jgi:hypothetical protein
VLPTIWISENASYLGTVKNSPRGGGVDNVPSEAYTAD